MFSFHQNLPAQTSSELHRWALTLAVHDRLSIHGMAPAIYRNKNRSADQPLVLHTGLGWVGPTGALEHEQINMDDWVPLLRERAENSASWAGISADTLSDAIKNATEQVNLALEMSIHRWRKLPPEQQHAHTLEARLWAAQQDGFDIFAIHYHETSVQNAQSLLKHGFDLHRAVARRSDDGVPDGAFFKPNTDNLELCDDPIQIPFFLKKGQVLTVKNRDEISAIMQSIPGVHVVKMQLENTDKRERDRFDALMLEFQKDPRNKPLEEQLDRCLSEWKEEVRRLATSVRQLFTEQLKSQGVRYVHIQQDQGSWGRVVESTIALHPEDICPTDAKYLPRPDPQLISKVSKTKNEPSIAATHHIMHEPSPQYPEARPSMRR